MSFLLSNCTFIYSGPGVPVYSPAFLDFSNLKVMGWAYTLRTTFTDKHSYLLWYGSTLTMQSYPSLFRKGTRGNGYIFSSFFFFLILGIMGVKACQLYCTRKTLRFISSFFSHLQSFV